MPPTRNQIRAATAAQLVYAVAESQGERYNTLINKLPTMILASGLLQTLAFLRAKSGNSSGGPEKTIENHIRVHLYPSQKFDLIDHLAGMSSFEYARTQDEVLRCLGWHRRFSRARFGEPENKK